VTDFTERQRCKYVLAETVRAMGFASRMMIDDDLRDSGSEPVERPCFQKLIASVCSGGVGPVFCIEASRLSRNGGDGHHLIGRTLKRPAKYRDFCAYCFDKLNPEGSGHKLVKRLEALGFRTTLETVRQPV